MYVLTLYGRESEGVYAVRDENGDQIVYLFEEEDDATRYAMLLEEDGYPEIHIIELDGEKMLETCKEHGYPYAIITPDDIVIPPNSDIDLFDK